MAWLGKGPKYTFPTWHPVHWTFWVSENSPLDEPAVLVASDETGLGGLYSELHHLCHHEETAREASQLLTALGKPHSTMGRPGYGLHCGTPRKPWQHHDLDGNQPFFKASPDCGLSQLPISTKTSQTVHCAHLSPAQSAKENHLQSGDTVYC